MENLCLTCAFSQVIRGHHDHELIIRCQCTEALITFPVARCSEYKDQEYPLLGSMQMRAWLIRTDARKKFVGFTPPKKDNE
jgi:hypothetical protein